MKKRVTLQQVAKAANVSLGTASNALNHSGRTSAATARKVKLVADRLGYAPDPSISIAMSKIRQGRFHAHEEILAYVTAYPDKDKWRQWHEIRSYWEGAQERANQLGYRLIEYWLGDRTLSESRHSDILFNRGVRGLILAPHPDPEAKLKLDWQHFAAVTISRSIKYPVTHRVLDDHVAIMHTAMRNLIDLGYKRIGFAMNRHRVERANYLWTGAYLAYQQNLTPENRLPMCIPDAEKQDDPCGRPLIEWFREHRPDAIVGIDPPDIEFLEENGISCPRDYGFASISLHPEDNRFAGVIHNAHQVGETAVSQLSAMLRHNEFGIPRYPHVTMLEGYWKNGRSVHRRNAATAGQKR